MIEKRKQSSIKLNYIFNTAQQIISMLAPLITAPYVSRVLGADGIGIHSYTTANVTYFTLVGMLGIAGYGKREIALKRNNKETVSRIFWELNFLHLLLVVITLVPYMVLIFSSENYGLYYTINLIAIASSLIDINWFYQAYERFQFISIRNCAVKLSSVVCIFLFVKNRDDLTIYIVIQLLGVLFANLSLWLSIRGYIKWVKIDFGNLRHRFKEIIIYFIPSMAASVYSLLDKSVINWVTGSESENGYYEQATKILSMSYVFTQSLSTVSAPRMVRLLANRDWDEAKARIEHALQFMLMLAMPTSWGVIGIAKQFVPVFFGEGYETVVILLYIMMPLVVVLGFTVYLDGMYLVPSGQRGRSARAICVGAAVNLVTNFIFVYFWGAIGAALATLITECIVCCLMIWMSLPILNLRVIARFFLRYNLFGFIIFLVARLIGHLVHEGIGGILLQVGLCVILYALLLFIAKDNMLQEAIRMLKRKWKD